MIYTSSPNLFENLQILLKIGSFKKVGWGRARPTVNNMVWKSSLSKNKYFGKKLFFPIEKVQNTTSSRLDIRNILSVRPLWKNKLLLNEYLGDFMHFG